MTGIGRAPAGCQFGSRWHDGDRGTGAATGFYSLDGGIPVAALLED